MYRQSRLEQELPDIHIVEVAVVQLADWLIRDTLASFFLSIIVSIVCAFFLDSSIGTEEKLFSYSYMCYYAVCYCSCSY